MDVVTNSLFGVVTLLVGLILGVLVGRWSRAREWDKREQLMREAFDSVKTTPGCWVKAQVDSTVEASYPLDR
jgi:hypothetical protein